MTTLSYKMPSNRTAVFLQRLARDGYRGRVVRHPLLSPVSDIDIEDVDDEQQVRQLVRALEPLADPVLVPAQRRRRPDTEMAVRESSRNSTLGQTRIL